MSDPHKVFATMTLGAPSLDDAAARRLLEDRFGLSGALSPLVSERDQNFRVTTRGERQFVLKISNAGESPDVLDFQAAALAHVAGVAPELPVPHLVTGLDGQALQRVVTPAGECLARVVSFLPGIPVDEVPWTPALRRDLARTLAGLGRALRGFFHPAARHPLLWDVQQADAVSPLAEAIDDPARRRLVEANFARYLGGTRSRLSALRAQVIHNDCNPDNVLVAADDRERIAGIIDFGDMIHAPLINDLAIAVAYQIVDQADPVAAACDLVGAYHDATPLEPAEIDILFELIVLRLSMSVCICAWRARSHPENTDYILGHHEHYWRMLERLDAIDPRAATAAFRRACGFAAPSPGWTPAREAGLADRRRALLGPSLRLSYDEPLHIVRGEGVCLYDARGRAYLDAYNNVACVGHAHPAVSAAIASQSRLLNTNTRYLHEHIVALAEELGRRLPGDLSVCYFVCTGSEANDLAWQIARAVTGGDGAIVTRHAYHGNTTAVQQLSPEELKPGQQEDWVATVPAPDRYRCAHADDAAAEHYAEQLDEAIASLTARGRRPAAFFVDTIYSSDGIFVAPPGYLAAAWRRVRAAGGLCIADEVQAGYGRTGEHFWGFAQQDVVPDIVTLGKPMGNGHPLAAVITTPTIAEAFAADRYYFNTFGGNPVSSAAGLAVLDVLEREGLQENARTVGACLGEGLRSLAARHESIGDVRGSGLFRGVELVAERRTREPAEALAREVVNAMRREGVLIGRTGLHGNVLKIRPPLVFSRGDADRLVATLDKVLARTRM